MTRTMLRGTLRRHSLGVARPTRDAFFLGAWLAFAAALTVAGSSLTTQAAEVGDVAEPDGYRMDHYRSPVPKTLKGAKVVDGEAAEALWQGGDEREGVFIDVFPQAPKPPNLPASTIWRTPKRLSIEGSYWLPNVGYGVISPKIETYFREGLERLTAGDKSRPVVFFCLRDCWMSWNAAKRASAWGYENVVWFPDGMDAWQEFDLPTKRIPPEPGLD